MAARCYPRRLCVGFENLFPLLNELLMQPIHTEDMTTIPLHPDALASVEELVSHIAELVLQRQSMRAGGAEFALLENNRLALVRAHQDLSYALIDRHHRPKAEVAA
jgi:hypothetical protein